MCSYLQGTPYGGSRRRLGGGEPSMSSGFSITGSVTFPCLCFLTFKMGIWSRHEMAEIINIKTLCYLLIIFLLLLRQVQGSKKLASKSGEDGLSAQVLSPPFQGWSLGLMGPPPIFPDPWRRGRCLGFPLSLLLIYVFSILQERMQMSQHHLLTLHPPVTSQSQSQNLHPV